MKAMAQAVREKFERIVLVAIRRSGSATLPVAEWPALVKAKTDEALSCGFKKDDTLVAYLVLCSRYELLRQQTPDKELRNILYNTHYTAQQKLIRFEEYVRIYG